MVRFQEKKLLRSLTPSFVQWLKVSKISEDEQFQVLRDSQQTLLDAIGALVSRSQSLTYQISETQQVKLWSEVGENFSLEFIGDESSDANATQLYEVYFPTPQEDEDSITYHGRLLEGLDSFVDALAMGEVVEIVEDNSHDANY